jgi:endogenous inhibitor of DNA gyrase (YacG/DUF329 family)
LRDLGNWASDHYRIPAAPLEPLSEETSEGEDGKKG